MGWDPSTTIETRSGHSISTYMVQEYKGKGTIEGYAHPFGLFISQERIVEGKRKYHLLRVEQRIRRRGVDQKSPIEDECPYQWGSGSGPN